MSREQPARGRPRISRRRPGRWEWECHCRPGVRQAAHNIASQPAALRSALDHARYWHRKDRRP